MGQAVTHSRQTGKNGLFARPNGFGQTDKPYFLAYGLPGFTLPAVFQQMPFGGVFAVIFFVAVLFAAITSLMNLFETPIEALENQLKISRGAAVAVIALISAAVGIFIESGDSVGAWMDAVSIYIIPLGALLAAIMFFWVCPKGYAREQVEVGREKPLGRWFEPVTKYIFVGITLLVYVLGIFFGGIG